jgi:hypothetical protein
LARRGILGPDFDEGQEVQRLAGEQQGLEPEEEIYPITGQPILWTQEKGPQNGGQIS